MSEHDRSRPREGGRPPLGDGESTPVCVRLTSATYDAAFKRAGAERRTVPGLVRRAVDRYLQSPDDDDGDA